MICVVSYHAMYTLCSGGPPRPRLSSAVKLRSNPNIPNLRGQTALHLAARRGDVHIMLALIEKGAAVDAGVWRYGGSAQL